MKESDATTAILERLERIVESLQDNSNKMGQLLAVHDEKIDKQNKIDDVLFEKIKAVEGVKPNIRPDNWFRYFFMIFYIFC